MAYIGLDKATHKNTLIIQPKTRSGFNGPLGELLFSFLDIDLEKYGELFNFCGYEKDFEYEDLKFLIKKYPKTYENNKKLLESVTEEFGDFRDYALFFLLDNQEDFESLYNHPAVYLGDTFEILSVLNYESFVHDLDFYNMQKYFNRVIDFCFLMDDEKLANLSPKERYTLFLTISPPNKFTLSNKTSFYVYPYNVFENYRTSVIERMSIPEYLDMDNLTLLDLISMDEIRNIKNNCNLLEVHPCSMTFDFLSFELMHLLSTNATIKRCTNCGKLFIPSGKYNTDCCDRIPEGQKYSCKKLMAQKRRKEKVNSDPITKEYEKAYKRMYARVSNGSMKKSEFMKWSDSAKKKRDHTITEYTSTNDQSILQKFKEYLGNK